MNRLLRWLVFTVPCAALALNPKCPADLLEGSASIDSRLEAGGCRLRDLVPGSTSDLPAREFTFEARTRGILTLDASSTEFDTVLVVTAPRLAQVATNDDSATGRTDSRIVMSATPDTYSVLLVSKRGSGAFTLKASFREQTDCQPRDFPASLFTGALNDQSCRFYDGRAPTGLNPPADLFRFKIDGPKVLTVLMQSRAIDSFLVVAEAATGRQIAFDDDGADGVADSLLISSLAPGDYYLMATSATGVGGAYTLDARLEDPVACETRDLGFGDTASGQLAAADCRLLDVLAPDGQENRVDLYRINVTEPGILTAEVTSTQISPAILLMDANRKILDSSVTPIPGRNQTIRLELSVRPGDYLLGVTHTVLQVGNYQLRATVDRLRACDAEPITPGGSTSGALRSTDCRYYDAIPLTAFPGNAKPYQVTIAQAGQLKIDMASTDVDSFLVLLDPANKLLAQNNDSGGGRDARIHARLEPGTYTVLATTAALQTGNFTIRLAFGDPPVCPASDTTFGDTVTGQLAVDDCLVRDLILEDGRPLQSKIHRFELPDTGTITADATSFAFAPALILVDGAGRRIVEDQLDQTAVVGAARIRRSLPAGKYAIVVTATAGLAGDYYLRIGLDK